MTPEAWFDELATALVGQMPPDTPPPGGALGVTDDERDALLDLARVAAHTSERWAAPVSTFMVGVALHAVPASERVAMLRRLVEMLEPTG